MNSKEDEVMAEEVQSQKLDEKIKLKSFSYNVDRPLHKWSRIPESKLIFIIRMVGKLSRSDEVWNTSRTLFKSLRLLISYTGVFVKADERIMVILRKLKPFVTYRYPSLQTVQSLIYNLGAIKLNKKITRLRDNPSLVDQAFGKYNIRCIDDIVNEVANVGSHFNEVSKALVPFPLDKPKLRKPRNGRKKRRSDGGDAGKREDHHINELLCKLKITS